MTALAPILPKIEAPSPMHMKRIWADFKQYVADEVVAPMVEFAREVPARASATCKVVWESPKNNPKAFAIVNWFMRAGGDAVKAFDKGMGAGASGGGGIGFKAKPALAKPGHTPGQNPNWIRPR